jgi:hypothetical protein
MLHDFENQESVRFSLLAHAERDKERLLAGAYAHRSLDPLTSKAVESYWEKVEDLTEQIEQLGTVKGLLSRLDHDLDSLKTMLMHSRLSGSAAERALEEQLITHLVEELMEVRDKLRRRLRHLSDEALLRYLLWNPATPNSMPKALQEHEKEKDSKSRSKRLRAVHEKNQDAPKVKEAPKKDQEQGDKDKKRE